MVKNFRNIGHLKKIISRIPARNVLDCFIEFNFEAIKELMMPGRYKIEDGQGRLFCLECEYIF